ncbi:hypothetical protein [Rugosimonospora africana]|uniref:hypothetical protein n=1 Tax=Rugosimonospora africana TaxID=556532 RepID=UPI001EF1684F|nr:hypothetical protein [Rugosimonospora africana]
MGEVDPDAGSRLATIAPAPATSDGQNRDRQTRDGQTGDRQTRDRQWLLTVLPAAPLLLLLLRLWYLSRQNLQTMLLLVQDVSPLGLISTLLITLVWILPLVTLVGRTLGELLRASAAREDIDSLRLVRAGLRIPPWVVALSVVLAALTWQLRFLPLLLMMTLAVSGLGVRNSRRNPLLVQAVCVALPIAMAILAYLWLGPAIVSAVRQGQAGTALLLVLPPALAILATGPVPRPAARPLTSSIATVAVLLTPFLVGANFLKAPILPTVAVEIDANPDDRTPPEVWIGYVISVNDRMTTLLDQQGTVRFVLNDQVMSETICPDNGRLPTVPVTAHGWQVEQPMLSWIAPAPRQVSTDPRCEGRPLHKP